MRRCSRSAYESIGGVSGALAGRAEELYADLDDGGQEAARQLFLQLVALGDACRYTPPRRAAELASLDVDQEALGRSCIEAFGASRLLSFDRDPRTAAPTVEVGHEALLEQWERLAGWIDGARDDIRAHRRSRLRRASGRRARRDASFLLRGSRARPVRGMGGESGLAHTELEREYLGASIDERCGEAADEAQRGPRAGARAAVAVSAQRTRGGPRDRRSRGGLTFLAFREQGRSNREARIANARSSPPRRWRISRSIRS